MIEEEVIIWIANNRVSPAKMFIKFADQQVKKALEEVEKSLINDEQLDIERAIDSKWAAGCKYQRNKTQEVIDKLKTK